MDRFSKIAWPAYWYLTVRWAALLLLLWSFAYIKGKSIKIDMLTPKSIYPCLDSFNLLITTPNITNDNYIRLIRVYTSNHSNRYYASIQKLDYVREFKLPVNNLLKFDCQFFAANFRYYCFVFVALSGKSGAVLVNGKPHCRPTTMEFAITSTSSTIDYDLINSTHEQLRPAGPSYKFNPTKSRKNNIFGNSRRVSYGNTINDNYFDEFDEESIAQFVNINCKCSDSYNLVNNVSFDTIIVNINIIKCNNNEINKVYNSKDDRVSNMRRKYINVNKKNLRSSSDGNYVSISSTNCILNLSERNYKMKVQQLESRDYPVIYVESTHFPNLIVREGRLAIDPQLDINNKSQTHFLKSQYLRIESFYSTNITLKLILLKSDFLKKDSKSFVAFMNLTPIHYTSLILIVLIVVSLLVLILMSISGHKRRTIVKIVTPSEEGEQTHTSVSYMDQTSLSQFSLADNQSLEMDYYDYLLPFVPRPNSRSSDLN